MTHQQDLTLVRVVILSQIHLTVVDAVHVLELGLELLDLLLVLLDDGLRTGKLLVGSVSPTGRVERVVVEALGRFRAARTVLFETRLMDHRLLMLEELAIDTSH